MARRLPPLSSLRLFEAVGRHLSFRSAAEELDVTASAVSHGMQSLEDWLGVPLLARKNRVLSLTDAGSSYLPVVREVLTLLASASDQIPTKSPRLKLALSVSPTFASRALLPRLSRFTARRHGLQVDIDTSQRSVEFPRDGFDLAIRRGDGQWDGLAAFPLLTETLVPVCSPELLQRLGPLESVCDAPLIHLTIVKEDWAAWAHLTGQNNPDCKRGLKVDTIQMTIDAALQGLGIALGRRPLIDQELEAGHLVTVGLPAARAKGGYWIVALPETMLRPEIIEFREWLEGELSQFNPSDPNSQFQTILAVG